MKTTVNNLITTTVVDVMICCPSFLLKLKKAKTKTIVNNLVVVATVSLLLFCPITLMKKTATMINDHAAAIVSIVEVTIYCPSFKQNLPRCHQGNLINLI